MESIIAAQCFIEQETGLVLDMAGNNLLAGSVIMCKLTPFVIMKDGDIDYMGGGKMEMVYWNLMEENKHKMQVKFEIYKIRSPRGRPMGKNIAGGRS